MYNAILSHSESRHLLSSNLSPSAVSSEKWFTECCVGFHLNRAHIYLCLSHVKRNYHLWIAKKLHETISVGHGVKWVLMYMKNKIIRPINCCVIYHFYMKCLFGSKPWREKTRTYCQLTYGHIHAHINEISSKVWKYSAFAALFYYPIYRKLPQYAGWKLTVSVQNTPAGPQWIMLKK